jgi:hypothetical protein
LAIALLLVLMMVNIPGAVAMDLTSTAFLIGQGNAQPLAILRQKR